MTDKELVDSVRADLFANVDPKTAESFSRFFKEEVSAHGVKLNVVDKIGKRHFKLLKDRSKEEIFRLCEELLKSDYSEEAFIAFGWAYQLRNQYEPADFEVFEAWVDKYVNNWAKCDSLCNHTVAAFIDRYPEYVRRLIDWTSSDNRWKRRAAAVTLVLPARRGDFLAEVFELADRLLLDKDDLVRKGYGWVLKEASRQHQREVFDYVMSNRRVMPRTSLRYAIEKMPPELRKKAMAKG